jgi:glucosamine 6-phosphate synthetase-like amidotransferase/phosphosugar isomerase protein
MCGLAVSLLVPGPRTPGQLAEIITHFTLNLLANQERGSDATGVALVSAKGYSVILKKPIAAANFIESPDYLKLMHRVDAQTLCLLGHTRKPTKGTVNASSNNHPLIAGNVVGIHNGQILNDDELFTRWQYPREGAVDSEIIFRTMDEIDPGAFGCSAYWQQIQKKLRFFQGNFTFAFVDLRVPEHLIVVKKDQPLSMHWDESSQVLNFSSRYLFLRKTFGAGVVNEKLGYRQAFCFNVRQLLESKSTPAFSFRLDAA